MTNAREIMRDCDYLTPSEINGFERMLSLPFKKIAEEIICVRKQQTGPSESKTQVRSDKPISKKKIYANVEPSGTIDTNIQKKGMTKIATVSIENQEGADEYLTISVVFDGTIVSTEKIKAMANSMRDRTIMIPATMMSRDETYEGNVCVEILDSEEGCVITSNLVVMVRSRFDLDKRRKYEITAKSINPMCPSVKKFVTRKDGELAKQMKDKYNVKGYQSDGQDIIRQMSELYNAVKKYGMAYVSDTECVDNDGMYQRVRTPDRVLSDHSGNCFELSILFASMLECMDFETVVIFPHGHAMPGIVLDTDAYMSSAVKFKGKYENFITHVSLDNGKHMDVLVFESTFCAHPSTTFGDSVERGTENLRKELEWIEKKKSYCITRVEKSKCRFDGW